MSRPILILLATAAAAVYAQQSNESVDAILAWLPPDTETILVSQQPFPIQERDQNQISTVMEAARSYGTVLLGAAENGALFKALTGRTLRLVVSVGRHFGEKDPAESTQAEQPNASGMTPYQACAAYVFAEPIPAAAIPHRPADNSVMGQKVWISKGSYFLTLVKPDTILICNRREFFREVVSRLDAPHQSRAALPPTLPEWKQLDRTAPLWGLSHYASSDSLQAAIFNGGNDVGATGIAVEFGVPTGTARAHMLAKQDPWHNVIDAAPFNSIAKSRESSPGVWELSVDTEKPTSLASVFIMMSALGFFVMM